MGWMRRIQMKRTLPFSALRAACWALAFSLASLQKQQKVSGDAKGRERRKAEYALDGGNALGGTDLRLLVPLGLDELNRGTNDRAHELLGLARALLDGLLRDTL